MATDFVAYKQERWVMFSELETPRCPHCGSTYDETVPNFSEHGEVEWLNCTECCEDYSVEVVLLPRYTTRGPNETE